MQGRVALARAGIQHRTPAPVLDIVPSLFVHLRLGGLA